MTKTQLMPASVSITKNGSSLKMSKLAYSLGNISVDMVRNIGIIAHIDAGKTTVTENMLYFTGYKYKIGSVDDGTTVMDWMDLERERGITITAAATTCYWRGYQMNVIDTPGHVDFTAEVERSLRVLDGGIVIFDAVAGVQSQSEVVWRQADKYRIPRICFVNKMDRTGASLSRTVDMIEKKLHTKVMLIQLPWGDEERFRGVIDLIEERAWSFDDDVSALSCSEIPPEYLGLVEEHREILLERLAEADEGFMAAYLGGGNILPADIKRALRRVTIELRGVPVLCGSGLRNKGIQPLLDAVVDYLPSPIDIPPVTGMEFRGDKKITRITSDDESFAALAFKITVDPFMGRMVYLRVYSGKIKTGAQVFNSTRERKERLGRLLRMQANHCEEVEESRSGDIVVALGLKNTFSGDTLCDIKEPILLEAISFPPPVISVALEARTKVEQGKIVEALSKLSEEDPTFKCYYDRETGQTIISGIGQLHLDVITERLRRDFNLDVKVGRPQVAYKETISKSVRSEGRFIKQVGGHGQYGHVWLEIEPAERNSGIQFISRMRGGVIPEEYVPAVEAGVRDAAERGSMAGYPLVDIKVTLVDGSFHEVDSSEIAFRMAGSIALKEGVKKCSPVLLEPVMRFEVVTPKEFLGDVLGGLDARRAQIENLETQGELMIIHGSIPLAETFGYVTSLRSATQGRAVHSVEFSHYVELPLAMADQVISRVRIVSPFTGRGR